MCICLTELRKFELSFDVCVGIIDRKKEYREKVNFHRNCDPPWLYITKIQIVQMPWAQILY